MKKLMLTGCLVLFTLGFGVASDSPDTQATNAKGVQSLLSFPWPDTTCHGCED